jgi:hypothetical protein
MRFDVLRAQRLAAPVTVYVEQFGAHPLERDAAELYGPPDGYLDAAGVFHKERTSPADKPVYEVTLKPEDGLYPLPYMARQANGQPWEWMAPKKTRRRNFAGCHSFRMGRVYLKRSIGSAFLTKVSVVFLLQKPVDGIPDQVRSFSAGGKPGEADRSGNRSD